MNFLITLSAALIPLVMGFIWYHPKVFGNKWMEVSGVTEEKMKSGNMALIFGLTLVLSLIIAFFMQFIVIHQVHIHSFLRSQVGAENPESEAAMLLKKIDELFHDSYRTFKHGAFHGALTGIMFVTPLIAINALFERRGFKYIALHAGYWIITLALMGGIVCGFITM